MRFHEVIIGWGGWKRGGRGRRGDEGGCCVVGLVAGGGSGWMSFIFCGERGIYLLADVFLFCWHGV